MKYSIVPVRKEKYEEMNIFSKGTCIYDEYHVFENKDIVKKNTTLCNVSHIMLRTIGLEFALQRIINEAQEKL